MSRFIWCSTLWTIVLNHVDFGAAANNSTTALAGDTEPGYVISDIDVNETVSGSDLWCYECRDNFKKIYDPDDSPCLKNLSQIVIRQCGARDRFCRVERINLHRQVIAIERGCVEDCFYGCKFNGYGITLKTCTSCCKTYACNADNGARGHVITQLPALVGAWAAMFVWINT